MKISAVVLTKNRKDIIANCLKQIKFCDEIIVVDDDSTDNTVEIATSLGAKVFRRSLNDDFSSQRNFGLSKAKYEWVLFVDSDEIVNTNLSEEIKDKINNKSNINAYKIIRRNVFMGRVLKHSEAGKNKLLRLAKKNFGKWERCVHETWEGTGEVGVLTNPLYHNYFFSLNSFIKRLNYYSGIHAKENKKEGKRSSIFKIIFFPIFKFIRNYIFKQGFRDGTHGFVNSLLMSFHSFLSWSKLWIQTRKG